MPSLNRRKPQTSADENLAAAQLLRLTRLRPSLAIVLGSGFQDVLGDFQVDAAVPYLKLRGFPKVGVKGHAGQVLVGRLGGAAILVLSGRCHFYEGHSMAAVTFAIRMLAAFGIRDLLLTNAAGGLNRAFQSGDLMLITDHINLMGENPLRGNCPEGLTRFVDLTEAYDRELSELLCRAACSVGVQLRKGIYLAVSGPSYETPAEVRAFSMLGADAVGMSTVPETIVARQHGMRVAGLSCITNKAAGVSPEALSHAEVLETARRTGPSAANLLKEFARFYANPR